MSLLLGPVDNGRWLDCRNDSSETIPPFSPVRITGVDISSTRDTFLKVNKPNFDGAMLDYGMGMGFTGEAPIKAGKRGRFTIMPPFVALTNSTPTAGKLCGIASGAWTLSVNLPGFRIVNVIDNATRVLVIPGPSILKGKTSTTWTKGSIGTIEIWDGAGTGAVTSPLVSITAANNRFSTVTTGKEASIGWNGYEWDGVAAECP